MSVAPRGRPLWKGRIFSGRGPGNRPPSRDDDGRRDGPPPRPFYIFWFGDLHGMPSDDDLPVDDVDGWMHEMSAKVRAMGLRHYEIYPWRFEIVRIDPDTGRWADVTRREFFEVQRFFERMNEKYGFRMGGAYQHIRKLAGQKEEAHSEMYAKGVLKYGAMNGRPWHARLKGRDERKRRR